jgi:integrase/recombinase XerD
MILVLSICARRVSRSELAQQQLPSNRPFAALASLRGSLGVRAAMQERAMSGKQAKIITPGMLKRMTGYVRRSRYPRRNRVIVLLSAKAGLRACEIADLEWSMVLDGKGHIGWSLSVWDAVAKKNSGRRIPLHPDLRRALIELSDEVGRFGPIIHSERGGAMTANSIVNWFIMMYRELGFEGCSSHSGRRSFITTAARSLARTGGSLRDIQLLAGHRSIETTQGYIDGDTDAQRRLVALI